MTYLYVLVVAIWMAAGPKTAELPQADLETCTKSAQEFLSQDPEELDAKALSAMCLKVPLGKPA